MLPIWRDRRRGCQTKKLQRYLFDGKETSRSADKTKEEIWLSNTVAINETAVEHSADQLRVNDRIESEFVAKKGEVQLWRGVVVFTNPEVDCCATTTKSASHVDTERRVAADTGQCASLGSN